MRNQKNRTPPHIKINCWMYHLFLTPPIGVSWLPHLVRSPQPAGNCVPEFACEVGMQFPLAAPLGSHIPLRPQIPGRAFRQDPQPETTSHFSTEYWDVVSTEPFNGKPHPIPKANSGTRLPQPRVKKKASRISRLSHLYCFARRTANGEATRPARPSLRLRPCCPGPPWWGGPLRQPSCRAAS